MRLNTLLWCFILGWTAGQRISPAALAENQLDSSSKANLAAYREQIDSLDGQILKLLNERAKVVQEIAPIKEKYHLPVFVPKREAAVIKRLQDQNRGPLPPAAIQRLWEKIMEEMRAVEASK